MCKQVTYYARLVAKNCDIMGYTTYVFENLNFTDYTDHYIMCVRYPNWNQNPFDLYDIGYVNVKYVEAGIDKWFDGKEFIPYRYTDIAFLKFIPEKTNDLDIKELTAD